MIKIVMLTFCAILLGATFTIWCYQGGTHEAINVMLFTSLTTAWMFLLREDLINRSH